MGTFAGGVIVEPSRSFLGSGEVAAVFFVCPPEGGLGSSSFSFSIFFLFNYSKRPYYTGAENRKGVEESY